MNKDQESVQYVYPMLPPAFAMRIPGRLHSVQHKTSKIQEQKLPHRVINVNQKVIWLKGVNFFVSYKITPLYPCELYHNCDTLQ